MALDAAVSGGGPPTAGPDFDTGLHPIVGEIARQRRWNTLRFRAIFVATWLLLIAGVVGGLFAADRINVPFLEEFGPYILGGAGLTLLISVVSIVLAVIFATLGALGRLSSNPVIYGLASFYVSLVRGTPLLVQILFVYLALPQFGVVIDPLTSGILALSFNYGAYLTEIFRAGIQAVPRGQTEAAGALGMTDRMRMRRIVLPQAIRIVIPAIGNDFIAMTKDSSLVSIITVQELLWRAQRIGQSNFKTLETLIVAAAVYWSITIFLSFFQERLEKRLAESERRT
ncbi:MAG: amino acid ABC transporter permease [Chloroflexi bacterium]|nr:amino acid ABC transporter permease [Chloroflexota bacterium]